MRVDPSWPRRRSIRPPGYDYAQGGAYFVTVCVLERGCLFGDVRDGRMMLNAAGQAVQDALDGLPARFPWVRLDAFVVMPNRVHGIIVLGVATRTGTADLDRVATCRASAARASRAGRACPARYGPSRHGPTHGAPAEVEANPRRRLGAFKSLSAIRVNRLLDRAGLPLW